MFLIFAPKIDCGYTLELPRRVPTSYILSKNKKNIKKIKIFFFLISQLKKILYITCTWACFPNVIAHRSELMTPAV